MIWFNLSKLEEKISKNELSDKDGFNYVLAYFILTALILSIGSEDENAWITFLDCVLTVCITIWGLNSAFRANAEIDGKDFFKRFFAINWVISMRLFLTIVILTFSAGVIIGKISVYNNSNYVDNSPIKDLVITIFMILFEVIYYLLIINSIRRLKPITE